MDQLSTMPPPLPPEIFDLIVDFLHDETDALKACCIVSKPWVHRSRKHLFARVEFTPESPFKLWQEAFPDPSNSPARYTRSLLIHTSEAVTLVDVGVDDWIRTFRGVVRLHLEIFDSSISLAPLHGLSPTLKSLRIDYEFSVRSPEIFRLVCSFPLLKDLALDSPDNTSEVNEWDIPLTSPKLTGWLNLKMYGGISSAVRRLLELPGGLHFSKISVLCLEEDVESMTHLVSRCSDTLESLSIGYYFVGAHLLSAVVVGQYLTAIFWRSWE